MKKALAVITLIGTLLFLSMSAFAGHHGSYDEVVEATGDPAIDVPAVQLAVDGGGKILLIGIFDFGPNGSVEITKDVDIIRETDNKGDPVTKINGGLQTFYSPLPLSLPPSEPGPKIAIRNLHFDGARYTPIHIVYTSGAVISGSRITNVIPIKPPTTPFYLQAGAILGTRYKMGPTLIKGALTGNLIFSGNDVDLWNDMPNQTMAHAVFCNLTWGAAIEISDNVVVNVSRNAFESFDNYLDENGNGSLSIRNNNIIIPEVGIAYPTANTPNGIVAGWVINLAAAMDPTKNSNILIEHNYIEQQAEGLGSAIIVASSDAVTRHNHIFMGGGDGTVGILLRGPHGVIANNRIEGSGEYALSIGPTGPITASENRLHGNNFNHFYPKQGGFDVHFEIDSTNNVLLGGKGTVLDEGTDNAIKGNYEIYH